MKPHKKAPQIGGLHIYFCRLLAAFLYHISTQVAIQKCGRTLGLTKHMTVGRNYLESACRKLDNLTELVLRAVVLEYHDLSTLRSHRYCTYQNIYDDIMCTVLTDGTRVIGNEECSTILRIIKECPDQLI